MKWTKKLFASPTKVTIGDGRKASFWESNWIGEQPLKELAPALYNHAKRKGRTVQEGLANDQWIIDIRHSLTVELVNEFFEVFYHVWNSDIVPTEGVEDTITWRWTRNGKYSAKSAYIAQFNGRISSAVAKLIWKHWAPSKCKHFAWLLLQNRIWTADRLQVRQWPNNYFCQLCYRNLETT